MITTLLHRRISSASLRHLGYIRIAYAILALIDYALLHVDLEYFLSPTRGMLPISTKRQGLGGLLSLARFAAVGSEDDGSNEVWSMNLLGHQLSIDGDAYLNYLHLFGMANALCLLLGISPRLNAFLLYFNRHSFDNADHNKMLMDGTGSGLNIMARLWCFYLLFLPLNCITIWDGFGRKQDKSTEITWPMWPIYLWRWNVYLIFAAAGMGKYDGNAWIDGTAMYYVTHCQDECTGIFNPEFLFDRALPSKLMTWAALALESIAPITIWFGGRCRTFTVTAMLCLLFGMDVSMSMHTFEWYGALGWCLFFIEPENEERKEGIGTRRKLSLPRLVVELSIFVTLFGLVTFMTLPLDTMYRVSPKQLRKPLSNLKFQRMVNAKRVNTIADLIGIRQEPWTLYTGGIDGLSIKFQADVVLFNSTVESWESPHFPHIGKLNRKRFFNHQTYFQHVSECDELLDDGSSCEEHYRLLNLLLEIVYPNVRDKVASIHLYELEVWPPPYPDDIGNWDSLRRDLNVQRTNHLAYMVSDNANDADEANALYMDFLLETYVADDLTEPRFLKNADEQQCQIPRSQREIKMLNLILLEATSPWEVSWEEVEQ